jgi:hypothetical protein
MRAIVEGLEGHRLELTERVSEVKDRCGLSAPTMTVMTNENVESLVARWPRAI